MVLFIDTSSKNFNVIIFENEKIIDTIFIENIITHSKILNETVKKLLDKNNIKINDIDYFSVSVGPGSYTGIRVGLAYTLGLCEAFDKKIITVNLLDTMKYYFENLDIYKEKKCFPMINANNNNVYTILENEYIKINIDKFIEKSSLYKNILIVSSDKSLESKFLDFKNIEFIHINDINKICIKFINKKLFNNEFSDNYKYRVNYIDDNY